MTKTLLAVDDSVTMRKVLEIPFSGEDFSVITADSSQAALHKTSEPVHVARAANANLALAQRKGPDSDTFELERDRTGRHGSIMKYNLSRQPA